MSTLYTFLDLQDEVLGWLDELESGGNTRTNVKNAISHAHQERLSNERWSFMLWDTPETFTTAADTRTYALHQEFAAPFYFYNRDTKQFMVEVPSRGFDQLDIKWASDEGSADRYVFWGRSPVYNQPFLSTLSIVSTDATDNTAAKALVVVGDTADGVVSETLTPNGLGVVTSTHTFVKILSITKQAAWAGTLTMTSNSGTVTNLTLFPEEFARSYQQLFLLQTPTASETIEYRFYKQPKALVLDHDIPDIPPPYQSILVWDALIEMAHYSSDIRTDLIGLWQERSRKLEESMMEDYLEGSTINAYPRFVRSMDDDQGINPRVFR